MSFLQIYRASAGSGKTHTLTQDYLKLAFADEQTFSSILAVTFTNKASEEMKERIVGELNNLSRKGKQSNHYEMMSATMQAADEATVKERSQNIINNVLHNYSQFSVSTIDSFVQKVIRAFSYELGVQSGYRIEMDSNKVIDDLSEMLYKKAEKDPSLLRWLVRFAYHKIEAGQSWDFREEMQGLAKEIFKEEFHNFRPAGLKNTDNAQYRGKLIELLNAVDALKKAYEKDMADISVRALEICNSLSSNLKLGKVYDSIKNHLTKKIISTKVKDFEPVKTVRAALEGFSSWHAKSAKQDVISALATIFEPLYSCLEDAIEYYDKNFALYLSARNVLTNFHAFGILNDLAELLPQYRDENNLLLISDTTILLREIIANNDAPFIYEKVGNRFINILIDEFQDTSGFQWDNFCPLIQNSLGDGNFNLIVGDIKQSIYRWRGGDWKLLLTGVSKAINKDMIDEKTLDTNWRSKENIINFNNALFFTAPTLLQKNYNKELDTIMVAETGDELREKGYNSIIENAYSDSYQFTAPRQDRGGGRVLVNFVGIDKGSSKTRAWREGIIEKLPETINDLLENKNYKPKDITLLVRRNRDGKEVMDLLSNYMKNNNDAVQYQVVSGDSLFISNSGSVKLLMAALRFLNESRDRMSLSSLVYEYNALPHRVHDKDLHTIFDIHNSDDAHEAFLPEEFIKNTEALKKKQLYELVEELISIFSLRDYKDDLPYIRTFQDVILNFTRDENSGLNDYIEWWEKNGNKHSIQMSDKQDAVKVMTIHKSKGLAFRVVIIPFCDWPVDHSHVNAPVIWCKPSHPPFDSYPVMPIRYKQELATTIFCRDFFEEKLQVQIDALNMLYVACTRAEDELIIFSPAYDDKITNIADVLYNSIRLSEDHIYPATGNKNYTAVKKYLDGDTMEFNFDDNYTPPDEKERLYKNKHQIELSSYPGNSWRNKMAVAHNSSDFFIESVDYIQERVNYGLMMHHILSQIITPDDVDGVLSDMYFSGKITAAQKKELHKLVQDIVTRPSVSDWFSDNWEVRTESAILTSKGNIRIPDRILFGKNKNVVIDFKFGKQRDEYQEQIKEYMALINEIENKPTEGYIYYAENDVVEKARD